MCVCVTSSTCVPCVATMLSWGVYNRKQHTAGDRISGFGIREIWRMRIGGNGDGELGKVSPDQCKRRNLLVWQHLADSHRWNEREIRPYFHTFNWTIKSTLHTFSAILLYIETMHTKHSVHITTDPLWSSQISDSRSISLVRVLTRSHSFSLNLFSHRSHFSPHLRIWNRLSPFPTCRSDHHIR